MALIRWLVCKLRGHSLTSIEWNDEIGVGWVVRCDRCEKYLWD